MEGQEEQQQELEMEGPGKGEVEATKWRVLRPHGQS